MKLWRLVNRRFVQSAFSGEAARLFGGRWHLIGRSVVYCASSKPLAILEVSSNANLTWSELRESYIFICVDVPNDVSRETIRIANLSREWPSSYEITQRLGERWLSENRTCLLKVPSVTIPGEANYLINPGHPDFELLFARPPQDWGFFDEYTDDDSESQTRPTRVEQLTRQKRLVVSFGPKDIFLCQAPEDRAAVVVPLRDALFRLGVSCWVDFAEITVGDSIIEKVNEGLANARYVVVVISPAFLRQRLPRRQLTSALNREAREGIKVVLPMVVNYSNEAVDFAAALPVVEDKHYYTWSGDADAAAIEIARAVSPQAAGMFAK
jgi:RES domain-containing protein